MRGTRLVAVLVVLSALTLTALDVRAGSPFDGARGAVEAVLGPAQRAVGSVARSIGGVFDDSGDQVEQLERENAELRMERDVLKRSVVLWVKEATK